MPSHSISLIHSRSSRFSLTKVAATIILLISPSSALVLRNLNTFSAAATATATKTSSSFAINTHPHPHRRGHIHTSTRTSRKIMMSFNGGGIPPLPSSSAAAPMPTPFKVAVIGAGAAGLATARAMDKMGITTRIFEKDHNLGGVWQYHPNSKTRPVYRGLRTNLPREIMAYREFKWGGDGTTLSYVTHHEVKDYLKRYAETFQLEKLISFGCSVKQLTVEINNNNDDEKKDGEGDTNNCDWPKVSLEWEEGHDDKKEAKKETFDAVCICNGHYAAPSIPHIPGLKEYYTGKIMHSVEYDDPTIFKDQTVLCVGGRASGADLAREISFHATKVYLSDTTCHDSETLDNVTWVPKTMSVKSDSSIEFGTTSETETETETDISSSPKEVDVIIFCSGYDYQFPFINEDSNLDLSVVKGERRVKPLYEQLWHARYPSVSFVGLQHSVVPFPFFEVQAEAITSQIVKQQQSTKESSSSSSWSLPPLEERLEAAEKDANSGGPNESRVQDTHFLGGYQWDAAIKYAELAGVCNDELVRYIHTNKAIYDHSNLQRKGAFPGGADTYRYGSYVRDDDNESFQVQSMLEQTEMEVASTSK